MNDSPSTCLKCQSVVASTIVDGLCETCRSKAGETSIDASVPLLFPSPTVDLHAHPLATDDPHLVPTIKSDESLPENGVRPKVYKPDPIPGIELLDVIGTGGSATVYRGIQTGANRECAVKFVNRSMHASAGDRLGREVRAIASLDHPNIIRVYSCDLEGQTPYLVMDYAAGGSLADRLKANPQGLPIAESVALVENAARGIAQAHDRGIVHRDIKPGNLLLDADGRVKVSDFGLARNFDNDPTITKSQAILGTPAYMSPEQARSEEATPQSDVYGIGAVLYDCLTGRPPFPTRDYVETLTKVKNDPPTAPRSIRKSIPRDLEAICLKCLKKDPSRRYGSASDLAEDLAQFQKGERTVARPEPAAVKLARFAGRHRRRFAIAATILVALLASIAFWLSRDPDRLTRAALQNGQRVDITPRWTATPRVLQGEFITPDGPRDSDPFEFIGQHGTFLVLCRDPGIARYRIRAELAQVEKGLAKNAEGQDVVMINQVGIFAGYEVIDAKKSSRLHVYSTFGFSERGLPVREDQGKLFLKNRLYFQSPYGNWDNTGSHDSSFVPIPLDGSDPKNGKSPMMRTIGLDVTPEALWGWSQEPDVNGSSKTSNANSIRDQYYLGNLISGVAAPKWNPRSALGIYAIGSRVQIRRVTIEPLTP